jgi:rare lipoprotein A (peptidoglycan hydrolase)
VQRSIHYREGCAQFRHNLNTLPFDIFRRGLGHMRGWVSSAFWQFAPLGVCAVLCLSLANCSNSKVDPRYGVSASPRVVGPGEPVPKGGGTYRVGEPYVIGGRVYVPEDNAHYRAEGLASWYGDDFHGRLTANGEVFDLAGISAAHPTLPLPSYARVTNLTNGRSLIVRVNDRGPYHSNRIMDLSVRSAQLLGFHGRGTAPVRVEYVGRAPIEGSDDRVLEASLRHDRPAPAPGLIRSVAQVRPAPLPAASASAPNLRTASIPINDAVSPAARRVAVRTGVDGTDQFLNGRGLY